MHLRAIILNGFKTFARRTEIRFDGGVVAIVGPNGSGKSNIVDAFKWALGETQAKDLRGKRMEEVIYAGGERTPRAGSAEVSLVLDNSDRRLPVDYEEVEIRRRVDRSGESEYFLNASRVRRRDLQQILASTGLTVDSYAIVNQGDIEAIVTCTPEQRRQLVEEAAQVRGVKAQRAEAAARMTELAQNLLRLEDVRQELEPRREQVRTQAEAAREAAAANVRLEVLKGSMVWEEWREARDAHRRAHSQQQSLERRLTEASAEVTRAEADFQAARQEMESAQDRRLSRQRAIGALRLEVAAAEHSLALAAERRRGLVGALASGEAELRDLEVRERTLEALRAQLAGDKAAAQTELAGVPADPPLPAVIDAGEARRAATAAEEARRALAAAASDLAAARSRRQFLEESLARLQALVVPAESRLEAAQEEARTATDAATAAANAAAEVVRIKAEQQGLEVLWPSPRKGLLRVGDLLRPEPGYEAALSAALGPLVDCWVAPDLPAAEAALAGAEAQQTVLLPASAPMPRRGSLYDHVGCDPDHDWLARRLLGAVVVGKGEEPTVSPGGDYRAPGIYRSGPDRRVHLAARHRDLAERLAAISRLAADAGVLAERSRSAESEVASLREAAGGRGRLDETAEQLEAARQAEGAAETRSANRESGAQTAARIAEELARDQADRLRRQADHGAEKRRLELERLRWRERLADLERQLEGIRQEAGRIEESRAGRAAQITTARTGLAEADGQLPDREEVAAQARERLDQAEQESPVDEAELAQVARRVVACEEARVDARLRARTLEGNLALASRDAELVAERMEEIRGRMPLGQAPEEVPGGKAREREMRALERRLEELGPTNPLAESEHSELEERCRVIDEQLVDIGAARADLEELVERLRAEEDSRYDAVFGAVAANFQEYFAELTAGGKATLAHSPGSDGPRSGVEILVQPPRKKLQNITLLSSGERSMTALAFVLGLEEVNPSPFVILDEVDAALDDANVERYGQLLERLGQSRQLLVITHNHVTMAHAGSLYGIHLDESGRSSLVSVSLEEVRRQPARRAASA